MRRKRIGKNLNSNEHKTRCFNLGIKFGSSSVAIIAQAYSKAFAFTVQNLLAKVLLH